MGGVEELDVVGVLIQEEAIVGGAVFEDDVGLPEGLVDLGVGVFDRFADGGGGALGADEGEFGAVDAAFAFDEMAVNASIFAEEFGAVLRVAGWGGGGAFDSEGADEGDDLPDLIGGEELAWHGGAFDAIGDVLEKGLVGGAVEELAGVEGGAFAALAGDAVAIGAMGAEDAYWPFTL